MLGVDPALNFPNVSLMTNAYVETLGTSANGREVTTVRVKRNGAIELLSAAFMIRIIR